MFNLTKRQHFINYNNIVAFVAICMILYHLLSTQFVLFSYLEHQNIHLAFALTFTFLISLDNVNRRSRLILVAFVLLSVVSTGYIHIYFEDLIQSLGFPSISDVVIGSILIIIIVEATRRTFGPILPIVAAVFILYAFFGYLLPLPLTAMRFSFSVLVSKLAIAQGLYGTILGVSANYLFLFITFGAILEISGATTFFMEVGKFLSRNFAGGSAITAVVSSALLATVSGSVIANVATSGSYTIPMMKRDGYKPEHAAAIEAAASTGGQIMPPVMGAAAFVMSGVTGIPYFNIMIAAFIPATIYFLIVGIYAQLQALKLGKRPVSEKINVSEMLLTSYIFIVPIGVLTLLLVLGYTPRFVIFWSILTLIAVSMIRKDTRPSLKQWIKSFVAGAKLGSQIGVSSALIGLVVSSISITGLGIKIPGLIESISGGNLFIAVLITTIVTLILGCGMPTVAAYILVSIVSAPVLINMGIPLLTTHLFIFFIANMSFITLPVALASLVAAKMAGASYFRTGYESLKAGLAGFIVPILLIYVPSLMLQTSNSSVFEIVFQILSSILLLVSLQIVLNNYFLISTNIIERIVIVLGGVMLSVFLITNNHLFLIGLVLIIAFVMLQLKRWKIESMEKLSTSPNITSL